MRLLAISVALPTTIDFEGRSVVSGICKEPVDTPVMARKLGLAGDGQADLDAHGGGDKAIYVYSNDNYRYWQQQFEWPEIIYGRFGENLTVEGMTDEQIHIGDTLTIGALKVQVTQPRIPCYKLGLKMGMADFPRRFLRSGRVGFYLRVLEEAEISVGAAFEVIERDPVGLTIKQIVQALLPGPEHQSVIERALAIKALSAAWRVSLEKRR